MKLTFEKRIAIYLWIAPLLFILAAFIYTRFVTQHTRQHEIFTAQALTKALADQISHTTKQQDIAELHKLFGDYIKEPSIISVTLFLPTGSVWYHEDKAGEDMPGPAADATFMTAGARQAFAQHNAFVYWQTAARAYIYYPVYASDTVQTADSPPLELIGYVELGITTHDATSMRNYALIYTGVVLFIFVGLGAWILYYIFHKWHERTAELERSLQVQVSAEDQLRHVLTDLTTQNALYMEINHRLEDTQRQMMLQQAQLIETERLATLGELASMVAHEINNALSGIGSPVDTIIGTPALDEEKIWYCWESDEDGHQLNEYLFTWRQNWAQISDAANLIKVAGHRAETVVRDLQGLVGGRSRKLGKVNLSDVFLETIRLQKNRFLNIELIQDFPDKDLFITSTSGQIGQIYMNLLINAVHALENRPNPTITVKMRHENSGVKMWFADNGCGMSEEIKSNLFKPFFTTKKDKGTGIGLSTTQRIVNESAGTIQVESQEGVGTTFIIWLPYEIAPKTLVVPAAMN